MRFALIVEDHRDLLDLYAFSLEVAGWSVLKAENMSAALRFAAERPPDLVITDLAMPGGDGSELAGRIRVMFPGRRIPIIVVTGQPDHLRRLAGGSGTAACHFLAKPVTADALQALADRAFRECGHACPGPPAAEVLSFAGCGGPWPGARGTARR
jgi:DNA-binding response OmpR family regulator